jgi:O-glycosyl hydrolase
MYAFTTAVVLAVNVGLTVALTRVNVDTSTTYQTIDGFGFSEALGFGVSVEDAPVEQQEQTLNYLFSTTEGAGLTILRNRIAADPADTIEPNSPGSPSAAPTYVFNGDDLG